MLKECLPVYPREYSMILNKNSTSSTINSLQGLSGSSQSGWCCRNPSVFHMFFISGGSKSERISTTETTRNDDHLQVGTLFNMVGAGQVGSTAASFDRFQKHPKTSGKGIFEIESYKLQAYFVLGWDALSCNHIHVIFTNIIGKSPKPNTWKCAGTGGLWRSGSLWHFQTTHGQCFYLGRRLCLLPSFYRRSPESQWSQWSGGGLRSVFASVGLFGTWGSQSRCGWVQLTCFGSPNDFTNIPEAMAGIPWTETSWRRFGNGWDISVNLSSDFCVSFFREKPYPKKHQLNQDRGEESQHRVGAQRMDQGTEKFLKRNFCPTK